jgi:hypothetical protein
MDITNLLISGVYYEIFKKMSFYNQHYRKRNWIFFGINIDGLIIYSLATEGMVNFGKNLLIGADGLLISNFAIRLFLNSKEKYEKDKKQSANPNQQTALLSSNSNSLFASQIPINYGNNDNNDVEKQSSPFVKKN